MASVAVHMFFFFGCFFPSNNLMKRIAVFFFGENISFLVNVFLLYLFTFIIFFCCATVLVRWLLHLFAYFNIYVSCIPIEVNVGEKSCYNPPWLGCTNIKRMF